MYHALMGTPNIVASSKWKILPSGPKIRYLKLQVHMEEEEQNGKSTTFICIPGNPGNELFYVDFGERLLHLYSQKASHKGQLQFISIAHANHVPLEASAADDVAFGKQRKQRFNLYEQIELKMEFLTNFLSLTKNHRIYLIGHSIGAYISLRILPRLLENGFNVITCFCLFPTVEEMAATPCGRWVGPLVKLVDRFDLLFRIFLLLLNCVPNKFKRWFCLRILGSNTPHCVQNAFSELINTLVTRNIAHMANHELNVVREFDNTLLAEHNERVVFFYGRSDKWAPLEFAEKMRQRLPDTGRVLVDTDGGFEHAFVLNHSQEMAEVLIQMIENAA